LGIFAVPKQEITDYAKDVKKKKSTSRGNAMVEPKKKKTEPSRGKPQIRC